MYAAPVAVVPAARRGGAIAGPVLALCCLLFILFLIAATIVLALIPVYLPTVNPGNQNGLLRRSSVLDFSGNLGNDRDLDAQSCENIRNAMARGLNIQPNAFTLRRCALATNPNNGRRKRRVHSLSRHRRGQTSQGLQQIFIIFDLAVSICGQCLLTVSTFTETVTIFVDGVARTITFTATIIVGEASIPAQQGPTTGSTSAGATTSAGSSASAGSDSTTAGSGSTTAGSDSTTAGSGSTTAGSDSTTAGSDSTTAGSDSTTAGSDSTTAGSGSTTAGSDSTTAGSDSTTAGSDSTSPTVTAVVS